MKIGRYEMGYWLLIVALIVPTFLILRIFGFGIFSNMPEWARITLVLIFFLFIFGLTQLYEIWYLRHTCENHLSNLITRYRFKYRVGGIFIASAIIQGMVHSHPVQIRLCHVGKYQTTEVSSQVENAKSEGFILSKRGYLKKTFYRAEPSFDQAFDEQFKLKPAHSKVFSDAELRSRLVQIQLSSGVIEYIKYEKNEVSLHCNGLLTDEEKLEDAIEVISLLVYAVI